MAPLIVWFRQDLRLSDNPALHFASRSNQKLICVYILDEADGGPWRPGRASRWWLHHSLAALDEALAAKGGRLILRRGRAGTVLRRLIHETGADTIVWNRCYEPFAVIRDRRLKKELAQLNIKVRSFNSALLFEPWEIATADGKPFRGFTPFWRALRAKTEPGKPQPAPRTLDFDKRKIAGDDLKAWGLLPTHPNWAKDFSWTPGEKAARRALNDFLGGISDYAKGRDYPAQKTTSRLSPHLHWGEISPRQIWHAVKDSAHAKSAGADSFLRELGWREFCTQLLFHHPDLPEQPFDKRFEKFAWVKDHAAFAAWSKGQTGIPIVDAGMRQLWQTGWMHNRVRMIAASLLVKHLGIDWRHGQDWFWDTLVDADLANNAANWQWVAGSGADAAPFFRIFNPVLQGEKFDPDGAYVRQYVPELRGLPDKFVHRPWDAPTPPADYPKPIVDLAKGRARALKSFKALPKSKS